jgi:hypothetical protein
MYTLIEQSGIRRFIQREALPFSLAFVSAELFYHFGSFSLECLAFLTTWLVIGKISQLFKAMGSK